MLVNLRSLLSVHEEANMAEEDAFIHEIITSIKNYMIQNTTSIVGPSYHLKNKQLAELYLSVNERLKSIYHLTEAHASTLRQQTVIKYNHKEDLINNSQKVPDNSLPVVQGIHKKYVSFDSDVALQEESGLLLRIREMPKEWTVVQVTKQFDRLAADEIRLKDFVPRPTCLHIVRMPCGPNIDESMLVSGLIKPPEGNQGLPTLFDLMKEATIHGLRTKKTQPHEIRKAREMASQNIKEVVSDLGGRYLKEWKCLLLGSLCSSQYSDQVTACIDNVINNTKHQSYKLNSHTLQLVQCVVSGAAYLTSTEIQSAVACLVDSHDLAIDLIKAIENFKEDLAGMVVARRNPVILILDEELDLLPWELLPILKKHPVSRIPSIHFLHGLYHEHKNHIVNGCRLVSKADLGFYIVNPDKDLKEMEDRLVKFLKQRVPEWKGLTGNQPSEQEFSKALVDNNVFLYCGHFNGTHFLRPEDLSSLRVVALPLLFGCSSVALQELGGRASFTGVSDKYIMAASPCVLGMLWTVTSDDVDCMTVTLLNSWIPGKPVDLKSFRKAGDMIVANKEPELLRLLRHARDTALLFSNTAAFVARGIPVKINEI